MNRRDILTIAVYISVSGHWKECDSALVGSRCEGCLRLYINHCRCHLLLIAQLLYLLRGKSHGLSTTKITPLITVLTHLFVLSTALPHNGSIYPCNSILINCLRFSPYFWGSLPILKFFFTPHIKGFTVNCEIIRFFSCMFTQWCVFFPELPQQHKVT